VHGCGEYFPRNDEGDQFGKDGVSAEEDRRVEMFCFDDEIQPPVPGAKASKGDGEYAKWVKSVTKTVDLGAAPLREIHIRIVDRHGEPRGGEPYTLRGPGILVADKTNAEGFLLQIVPATAQTVILEYADYVWELGIAELAPASEDSGAAERLRNLRLGLDDDVTTLEQALQRIQAKFAMAITGELDNATVEKLGGCHGS
jgi:hypothetical protein